jgi:hypothetical protein
MKVSSTQTPKKIVDVVENSHHGIDWLAKTVEYSQMQIYKQNGKYQKAQSMLASLLEISKELNAEPPIVALL